MKNLTLILLSLVFTQVSVAKLTTKQQSEFSPICYKASKKVKNYPQYCGCVKNNLRWLLDKDSWNDAKEIFIGELSGEDYEADDGRAELDNMIMNVEMSCLKDSKYLAPKAKSEIAKEKK